MPNKISADKKPSNIKLAIVILAVIVCGIVLALLYMANFRIQSIKTIDTSVLVEKGAIGFNTTNLSLNFGTNRPGGAGYRKFNIESDYKTLIRITVTGDMSRFISFDRNNFIMQPYDNATIQVNINIPDETAQGEYRGKVNVYFIRQQ